MESQVHWGLHRTLIHYQILQNSYISNLDSFSNLHDYMLMEMNRLVVSPRSSGTTNEMKAVSTSPSLDVAVMLSV